MTDLLKFLEGERDGGRVLNEVPASREFKQRIMSIPQRVWTIDDAQAYADDLTTNLRTTNGTMQLNWMQGLGLVEAHENNGMALRAPVGKGKGLLSLLLPGWLEASKFVLIVPAHLKQRTIEGMLPEYMRHFKLHRDLVYRAENVIQSAQSFGTLANQDLWDRINPDHVIIDEGQYWKSWKTTRATRFEHWLERRWEEGNPVRLYFMSGSFFSEGILDIWFLLKWTLPGSFLMPIGLQHAKTWAAAIDEEVTVRSDPGALRMFMTPTQRSAAQPGVATEEEIVDITRDAFRSRLSQCPGIIIIEEQSVDVSVCFDIIHPKRKSLYPEPDAQVRADFEKLRIDAALPGDEWIADGASLWRSARELITGFYNVWNWSKKTPADQKTLWTARRRRWKKCIRQCIRKYHKSLVMKLDSELAVTLAAAAGKLTSEDLTVVDKDDLEYKQVYAAWMNIDGKMMASGPDMKPPTRVVWQSDYLIDWIYKQTVDEPAIIWTEHPAFGERLQEKHGIPYYGGGAKGIENEKGNRTISASPRAQGTGNNCQGFHRNWIISPPKSATLMEQTVGRTHRQKQKRDVIVMMLLNCAELMQGFEKCLRLANMQTRLEGPQKLVYGDTIHMPSADEVFTFKHSGDPTWGKPKSAKSLVDELDGIFADIDDEETA